MPLEYNMVQGVSYEEFIASTPTDAELEDPTKFTLSDLEDIRRIERILDVQNGTLGQEPYYLEKITCKTCGHLLTMYDFVVTGLIDASHTKSFVLHTLVGSKFIVNEARRCRCTVCGTLTDQRCKYKMKSGYGCGTGTKPK